VKRKKKQGMLYTKVLRLDSSERAREPKKKPSEKDMAAYGRERARAILSDRTSERKEERKRGSKREELASSAKRCVCTVIDILQGGREQGGRGASVCVQKGEKEEHILYLWVFAATVLSRRRLATES